MSRRAHRVGCGKSAWILAALILFVLAGCEPFWSTPETRARDYIEALVTAPGDTEQLRDIANLPSGQNPEALIDDLSARVGVDFLRARQTQGVSLKFVQGETRRANDVHRTVVIHVSYLQPGTPMTGDVRFLVRIEKDDQGRWRIARVTGDN